MKTVPNNLKFVFFFLVFTTMCSFGIAQEQKRFSHILIKERTVTPEQPRGLSPADLIEAELQIPSTVRLSFLSSFFNLSVSIYREGTLVVNSVVNVSNGSSATFDLSPYSAGNYCIEFTNTYGLSLYGEFEIE